MGMVVSGEYDYMCKKGYEEPKPERNSSSPLLEFQLSL